MELKKSDLYELLLYVATNDRDKVIDEIADFLDNNPESTDRNPIEAFLSTRRNKQK